MITVFYDGHCGLCAKEIAYYQKIAPENQFEWVNIMEKSETFEALGYSLDAGLKALHVRDHDNVMQIGVRGFITIWRTLPRWKYLAQFARLPIVLPLLEFTYQRFAAWRFKRLGYHCSVRHNSDR